LLRKLLVLCVLTVLVATVAYAAVPVVNHCIRVSATVSRTPPAITFSWPSLPQTQKYLVYRKLRQSKSWGDPIAMLPGGSTGYMDANVAIGDAYEYMFLGSAITAEHEVYASHGFIYAGLDVPLIDRRGKLILIVDNTYAASLDYELSRLQQDLIGDGWTVVRHDVSRTQSVTSIKQLIQADYFAAPANVKAVFLFGRIPVPYSGNCAHVKHEDNIGAAEADVFYADMNGIWTDTLVNHSGTSFDNARLNNVPADGRYDQSKIPSDTELQIGRVDLSSMQTFTQGEEALLRQYLNKDHNFRQAVLAVNRAGKVVDDAGHPQEGYRNFSAYFGASNVNTASSWFPPTNTYLWGSVSGTGSHTSNSVMGTTSNFLTDPQIVFTMASGSYLGDWAHSDDLLRAPLCTSTYGLSCIVIGPYNFFHVIALGDTLGSGVWLMQNYDSFLYQGHIRTDDLRDAGNEREVWINLMGDPTLRLNPVIPPVGLTASEIGSNTVSLNWTASADTNIQGYLVYRARGFGLFTRLTPSPITATSCTDSAPNAGTYTYMVRAVKLETNGSGAYYNPSQGTYQTVNVGSGAPAVAIISPLNQAGYLTPAGVVIRASVNPGYTGSVDFYNGAVKLGTAASAPYTYQWNSVPTGTYTLTAQAANENGTTISDPVTISVAPLPYELPAPWFQADIGVTGMQGDAVVSGGEFTITGVGTGITGSADAFHAVYQPLNVNGSIVAKVNSVQSPGRAGVFVRESLVAGSQGAALCISSTGTVAFSKRLTSSATEATDTDPTTVALPCWVKLTRSGDTVTAYRSSNGSTWVQVGTAATILMGANPNVGLAAFSGSSDSSSVAVLTDVRATSPPLPPEVKWRAPYEGDAFTVGSSVTLRIEKPDSPDSLFSSIAFYDGATLIGTPGMGRTATWVPSTLGPHTITAKVTDLLGEVGTNTMTLTVNPAGSTPPSVTLTSVMDGQCFAAPCDVVLAADAQPASGKTIARVEFYADGTLVGTSTTAPYSVNWTNVQPGTVHAVTARAVDSASIVAQSNMFYLYFFGAQAIAKARVSDIPGLINGSFVSITSPKVVTAASSTFYDGAYYIEEPDRAAGLKAIGGSVTLWDGVTLTGTVATDDNGEKMLQVSSIDSRLSTDPVSPLGMSNKAVSASGLLVTVWGKVTSEDSGSFIIDDGRHSPVTVDVNALAGPMPDLPDVNAYVVATGLAGYAQPGLLAVRPRSGLDIQVYWPSTP
jgi:hypothetical protein